MRQYNPFGFQMMTPVVKWIIIINVALHILKIFLANIYYINLDALLGLNYGLPNFYWFQYLTHMFMHSTAGLSHLIYNMLMLWMFGTIVENYLGSKRFLLFYLICGLGAAFAFIGVEAMMSTGPVRAMLIGASGAVFGVMFAFGYLFPNMRIYLYFLFPIKAKYLIIFAAIGELWMGIQNNPVDNVAHFAHLGGMVLAFILLKIWKTPRIMY